VYNISIGNIPWEILIDELLVKYSIQKTLLIKAGLSMGHIRLLTEWKAKREIKSSKEGIRTVRALQALRWYNGINGYNFFMLHKPIKIGYLAAIFQLITDSTMAFPASMFSGIRLK